MPLQQRQHGTGVAAGRAEKTGELVKAALGQRQHSQPVSQGLMQAQQDGCTQSQPDAPAGSQAACHCRSGVPVLSRKLPSRMVMRSTSVPMPPRPPVSSQSSPVPICPT